MSTVFVALIDTYARLAALQRHVVLRNTEMKSSHIFGVPDVR